MRRLSIETAVVAELVEEWVRTTVQAGHLLPSNPEILGAAQRLVGRLRNLAQAGVYWVHLYRNDDGDQWLVGGALEEPLLLSELFQSDVRRAVASKFTAFLDAEQIASVAIGAAATAGDVNAWIEATGLRWRLLEEGEAESTATPGPGTATLAGALHATGTRHFSVLAESELVALPEGSEQRRTVRIAVTRLLRLPTPTPGGVDDGTRAYVDAFLLHSLASADWPVALEALAELDRQLLAPVVEALPQHVAVGIGWELVARLKATEDARATGDEAPLPASHSAAGAVLRAIVATVDALADPRARHLVEVAWRRHYVDLDDVPESTRIHLRAALWADQFVRDPVRFVRRLHEFDDPDALSTYLEALALVYRALVDRGQFGPALVLLRAVRALVRDPATAQRGLAEVARKGLERIEAVPVGKAILALLRHNADIPRAPVFALLREVGAPAVPGLVHALRQTTDERLRAEILATLRAMGAPAAQALARLLQRPDIPVDLAVSVASLLGEVGGESAVRTLLASLRHRDRRVALAALDAALHALPMESWHRVVALWSALSQEVRLAALRRFAAANWTHPQLTHALVEWLDRYARGEEDSEREALAILHYLAGVQPDAELASEVRAVCHRIAQPGLLAALRRPVGSIVPPRTVREAAASVLAVWPEV